MADMSAQEPIQSNLYINFRPKYLKIKSKESYPNGERPYFSPDMERLLLTAADTTSLAGFTAGKIPVLSAMTPLDPKALEEIRGLIAEGLILLVPRIYTKKNTGELEIAFTVLAGRGAGVSKANPDNVREVFFEIARRSSWVIRNYEIVSQADRGIVLNRLLLGLAEGILPPLRTDSQDKVKELFGKICHKDLIRSEVSEDYIKLIHGLIEEEGILTNTHNCGYVHIPDQDVDSLFDLVSDLYGKKVIPKLVLNSPKLAENLISLRETVLSQESNLLSSDPSFVRKSIYSEEFAKLSHLAGKESPYADFFRLARVISQKSLEADIFTKGAREKAIENGLKKVILSGKGPLERYLSLSIGGDLSSDSEIARSVQEDPSLLSYVYYSVQGPEIYLCPSDNEVVKAILRELKNKYAFENLTSLSFLLLLFKNKKRLLPLLSNPDVSNDFCELAYACLARMFPWYHKLAFFFGIRGSLLASVFRELGAVQYKQMSERLKYEEKLSTIRGKLRQELITEVRDFMDSILERGAEI